MTSLLIKVKTLPGKIEIIRPTNEKGLIAVVAWTSSLSWSILGRSCHDWPWRAISTTCFKCTRACPQTTYTNFSCLHNANKLFWKNSISWWCIWSGNHQVYHVVAIQTCNTPWVTVQFYLLWYFMIQLGILAGTGLRDILLAVLALSVFEQRTLRFVPQPASCSEMPQQWLGQLAVSRG